MCSYRIRAVGVAVAATDASIPTVTTSTTTNHLASGWVDATKQLKQQPQCRYAIPRRVSMLHK